MLGVVWVIGLALFGHMCGSLGANIALGGKVSQSSEWGDVLPDRAVDGNRESWYYSNSCTHTQKQKDPWWRLDLEQIYNINTVTITNRLDCCSERLNGAEIHIGDSPDVKANPRCAQITSIAAGATQSFECNGMSGRYVGVVIPGREEYLTLCEVEVDGSPAAPTVNIALRGNVSQSSEWSDADRAVDGNRASWFYNHSCTHTQLQKDPWWRLDMEQTYSINTVNITNRKDCCPERLNGAEIHIGDSLDVSANPRCAQITSIAAGATQSFECKGMSGRYVGVVIPGREEYLTLCEVEVDGSPAAPTVNIALAGKVSQSSEWGDPERAVDGNRASGFYSNSCTHTQLQKDPWWRLDLGQTYSINTVTITNRKDCCPERLNGAEIHIGDSLDGNGNSNPRCAVVPSIPAGQTQSFTCNGMKGRYVNVVIPGRVEFLTLCEVEVYGSAAAVADPDSGTNIALRGIVSQSSMYENAVPQRAVDGNRESNWLENSCSHTQKNRDPWWRLDLGQTYSINTVTITNRKDCCHERLNGAEIRVGDSLDGNGNSNPRCAVVSSIPAGQTQSFTCNGMEGRYVNVVIPGRAEYLTLCEVEVYGSAAAVTDPDPGANIALRGKVSQSSMFESAGPQRAVDGNLASNWVENSCSHTQKNRDPWWRLDLGQTYSINMVNITNRGDCCPERLNGAEIHIGDSLDGNGNSNPRCAVVSSIPAGQTQSFTCNGMKGRYVNVVIPGREEYLTLCEVEVDGTPPDVIV